MKPFIPEEPDVGPEQCAEAELGVRFEDVCQDGRLRIDGVWPPMGRLLWSDARMGKTFHRLGKRGIRNVLARVVIHSENVAISPRVRAKNRVCYQLGHTLDARGDVNRILLNTWLRTESGAGQSEYGGHWPSGSGLLVARAYGQHVFTRPHAPPGQHRVLRLEDDSLPEVPEARVELPGPEELLEPPPGGTFIEPAPRPDSALLVFGLSHTDLNQHVNFLTYPRSVEDAALRRVAELGSESRLLLARGIEISYLKPCFAGDHMRVIAQAFAVGDVRGICAAFVKEAPFESATRFADFGRAHCVARLWLG